MPKGNQKHTKLAPPLPVRLTQRQVDWLNELKNADGISLQDHVRRAIDNYLATASSRLRRELELEEKLEDAVQAAGIPPSPRVHSRPKVTFR